MERNHQIETATIIDPHFALYPLDESSSLLHFFLDSKCNKNLNANPTLLWLDALDSAVIVSSTYHLQREKRNEKLV